MLVWYDMRARAGTWSGSGAVEVVRLWHRGPTWEPNT